MVDKKAGTVLSTLKDMESLFEFGGEMAPFLEELFRFLSDLMPILAKARFSIKDSASAMPDASDNIASAEMLSEDATHSIMDNLEIITSELEALTASDLDDATKERLGSLTDKVGEIGMALQFQDITSQHLQQASLIVEAIQVRMNKLFGALSDIGDQNDMVKAIVENYTQDEGQDEPDLSDQIHRDASVSQDDIDALFGA